MTANTTTVADLLGLLEEIASFASAASWDNVGLMVGGMNQPVAGVLVALDPTLAVLDEAAALGANVVVTHHPLIFHPVRALLTDEPQGRLLQRALAGGMAIIGCHTNLDQAAGGVSDALAAAIGLEQLRSLETEPQSGTPGFGRIGTLPEAMAGEAFLQHVADALALPGVAVAGPLPRQIQSVAVCGGSGSDLAETARRAGAQVFVSAEIKHSVGRWAEACGFCVIDAGHFATENPVVPVLAAQIRAAAAARGMKIEVSVTREQKDPFRYQTTK